MGARFPKYLIARKMDAISVCLRSQSHSLLSLLEWIQDIS